MIESGAQVDTVVIGAGFAGLYQIHALRQAGFSVRAFESGAGVGGTWYWNRYPGARCDVESLDYCYSFSDELVQEWSWTERYPTQPELLAYAEHVADRFDLRRDITFNTTVTSAEFDEAHQRWMIETSDGRRTETQFLLAAVGGLSSTQMPDIPGRDSFAGRTFHTGRWPHEPVDFSGERVAVLGTGSSGIQVIPRIAEQARHLMVLQRTPSFSVPARNSPLDPAEQLRIKGDYGRLREIARGSRGGIVPMGTGLSAVDVSESDRRAEYERRWANGGGSILSAFEDTMTSSEANGYLSDFVREQIRAVVRDPTTANLLSPVEYPFGSKRICLDTDYYATFNRDNVTLVDLRSTPIEEITPDGIRIDGQVRELDSIIYATGYDALTGPFLKLNIRGTGGQKLSDAWAAGPRTYLGLSSHGFPNLFMITGPGSPGPLSNMMLSIEQHVDWVTAHLMFLREHGIERSEAAIDAQDDWVEQVNSIASRTLFMKAASWYLGANVPGKPRVFMPYIGGVGTYRQVCEKVVAAGYEGFDLYPKPEPRADSLSDPLTAQR